VEANDELDLDRAVRATLFQGVRELLFNTVKHAGVKTANLQLWLSEDKDVVFVEVSDAGIGFDPVEVRSREGANGGYGLFSIRERLELLGGGMEVESSPGSGSRFILWGPCHLAGENEDHSATGTMESPAVKEAMAAAGESPAPLGDHSCPGRRIRVVLADDHPIVLETLALMLGSEPDIDVVGLASDGMEALQLVRDLSPDCVVMDLAMPRLDGRRATATIHRLFPDVKIVGISSEADDVRRENLICAGAVDLIHKNRSILQLAATLRKFCGAGG
jgi:CheY-like chemotaxis protein